MVFGAADTSLKDVWLDYLLMQKVSTINIIREIRLPREVAAVFVGAALAVSGAIMQGITRNPISGSWITWFNCWCKRCFSYNLVF